MDLSDIIVQFLAGITKGMLLFVITSGLAVVFGVLRIVNIAHGSFYMIGAFLCYTAFQQMIGTAIGSFNFLFALLAVPAICAVVGGLLEVSIIRRIYIREETYQLIIFYALSLILADLVKMIWGPVFKSTVMPAALAGSISVIGRPFPVYSLFVAGIGILIAVALMIVQYKTPMGMVTRAVVFDREMVNALGVNVPRVYTFTFMIGIALAAIGGALVAPMSAIGLGMDISILVESFAVVVIAGLGSVIGLIVVSLLVGVIHSFGILFLPKFTVLLIFAVMCAVLIMRPWGLFGKPEEG
jgi:branched-subunit amino acid ABC-type transport system permease component